MSKHQIIVPACGVRACSRGTGRRDLSREANSSGANGEDSEKKKKFQLSTSRIGKPYPVDQYRIPYEHCNEIVLLKKNEKDGHSMRGREFSYGPVYHLLNRIGQFSKYSEMEGKGESSEGVMSHRGPWCLHLSCFSS